MKLLLLLLAPMMAWMLMACSPVPQDPSFDWSQFDIPVPTFSTNDSWNPNQVSVTCSSDDCPQGVGVVMFKRIGFMETEYSRCTATLINDHQILTNEHCTREFGTVDEAYFFAPSAARNATIFRKLSTQAVNIYDNLSGPQRDVAIWNLEKPMSELQPRHVSRDIPADMSTMVAYVGNPAADAEAKTLVKFAIDKRVCHTKSHIPVVEGGVDDKAVGLSLFDCEAREGNSGSPVFREGDLSSVQVLLNTIWNLNGGPRIGTIAAAYFLNSAPPILNSFFAMGERLQCLPLDGQAPPTSLCSPRPIEGQLFAPTLQALIEKSYANEPQQGVVWGVRAAPAYLNTQAGQVNVFGVKNGAALVPYAICIKGDLDPALDQDVYLRISFYQLGFGDDGLPQSRAQPSTEPISAHIQSFLTTRATVTMVYNELGDDIVRDGDTGVGRLLSRKAFLPKCQPGDFERDRQEAIDGIPSALARFDSLAKRVPEPALN